MTGGRGLAAPVADEGILPLVLLGLTATTGVVDAVSFLALGHVFTANMTGNVVFLGFAAAGAQGLSIARSGTALVAFLGGAVIGGRLDTVTGGGARHRRIGAAFAVEAALLAGAAVADGLYLIIILTALAMGVRNATVRKLSVANLTTTVLTLTLAGLAADSTLAGGSNPGWARRTASVATLFAGAVAGAWLLRYSVALPLALSSGVAWGCAAVAYFANPPPDRLTAIPPVAAITSEGERHGIQSRRRIHQAR